MEDELGKALRSLGLVKGARNIKPAPTPPKSSTDNFARHTASGKDSDAHAPGDLLTLLPGAYLAENELGACLVLDHVYPVDFRHGKLKLGDLFEKSMKTPAEFLGDRRLEKMSYEEFLFLDTETTGLMGAGTFAFMVGLAFVEMRDGKPVFIVRQFFLRDPSDEPAMLLFLADLLHERPGLVTFNGRSFDLPLLDNRYVMNRLDSQVGVLPQQPHIDLLPPSRRLWRRRIGSCSLGSLEKRVLGVSRSQEDVPGWMIPGMYMEYLRSGDASDLMRVFYHNEIDMLSMVVLAARIARQFDIPSESDDPRDLLSLAIWQGGLGNLDQAEATLRMAEGIDMSLEDMHSTWRELGALLKRTGRRDEAVLHWKQIAATHVQGMTEGQIALDAHVELAKFYEWHETDLDQAKGWTVQAISLVEGWGTARDSLQLEELHHRLGRLERKIDSSD